MMVNVAYSICNIYKYISHAVHYRWLNFKRKLCGTVTPWTVEVGCTFWEIPCTYITQCKTHNEHTFTFP